MTPHTSRRRFLAAAAATGTVAGLNGLVLADDGDRTDSLAQQQDPGEFILLGGEVPGWVGYRLPNQEATGSANPTLQLQAGTTYTLLWENLDGQPHNVAIQDADGNNLEVLYPLSVSTDEFQRLNESAPDETQTLAATTVGGDDQGTPEAPVAQTEIISEQGAVQGVRFTASEEMAQYICVVHPNTMLGNVSVQTGGNGGGNGGANNSSG